MYTTIDNLAKRLDALSIAKLANDSAAPIQTQSAAAAALAGDTDVIAILEQFITDAGYYLDSILNGCLDMSLTANQVAVEQHCAWIALYNLHMRKNHHGDQNNPYRAQYDDAIKWATFVAKRRYRVGVDPERPSSLGYSTTSTTTPVLSDDAVENA